MFIIDFRKIVTVSPTAEADAQLHQLRANFSVKQGLNLLPEIVRYQSQIYRLNLSVEDNQTTNSNPDNQYLKIEYSDQSNQILEVIEAVIQETVEYKTVINPIYFYKEQMYDVVRYILMTFQENQVAEVHLDCKPYYRDFTEKINTINQLAEQCPHPHQQPHNQLLLQVKNPNNSPK